jgi:hypothetical protein
MHSERGHRRTLTAWVKHDVNKDQCFRLRELFGRRNRHMCPLLDPPMMRGLVLQLSVLAE